MSTEHCIHMNIKGNIIHVLKKVDPEGNANH
jgi:hypothetical protein